jgi:hypothetical protein
VSDNNSIGFVLIENRMDRSHKVEPVFIDQCVARQTSEGDLFHLGNAFQFGQLL